MFRNPLPIAAVHGSTFFLSTFFLRHSGAAPSNTQEPLMVATKYDLKTKINGHITVYFTVIQFYEIQNKTR